MIVVEGPGSPRIFNFQFLASSIYYVCQFPTPLSSVFIPFHLAILSISLFYLLNQVTQTFLWFLSMDGTLFLVKRGCCFMIVNVFDGKNMP
jgi:hypothetical protein